MSKSAASAKTEEYERVRGQPFQKISGRPEWSDYMTMKKQAGKIAANAETGYSWGETTGGTQYGLLADIIGGGEQSMKSSPESQRQTTRIRWLNPHWWTLQ